MPWKPRQLTSAEVELSKENHALQMALLNLRQQLSSKQTYTERLEYLLRERLTRIDELNAKLEQSRQQIRRLGLENELLTAMIAAPPREVSLASLGSDFVAQSGAAMLAPK
jgi:selenocysteine lyase/cysteine desulfurase